MSQLVIQLPPFIFVLPDFKKNMIFPFLMLHLFVYYRKSDESGSSDGLTSPHKEKKIDSEFIQVRLEDLDVVATLGMGGFGRVELVRTLTMFIWISHTFDYNFGIKHQFAKYLKESCR